MLTAESYEFDPARDGFGFRNPVGLGPSGGKVLRRIRRVLYGRGLCFGMAVAALLFFADRRATRAGRAPTGELSPTPAVLDVLFECHSRQFRPRAVLAVVRAWVASGGGRAGYALGRLRLVGASADPHVLCFGPAPNRRFFFCLARAHAVVPYRVEEGRVYVYDPNYPGDRGRFVEFWTDDEGVEFAYDGFRSEDGWGITLLPLSAAVRAADRQNARLARFA